MLAQAHDDATAPLFSAARAFFPAALLFSLPLTGTRESAHPIHKYLGVWPLAKVGKKDGSEAAVAAAQALRGEERREA